MPSARSPLIASFAAAWRRRIPPSPAVLDGGRKQVVQLDLKPGKYALLCFVPDREGGPPHVARGMVSEVEVR